MSCNTNKKQHGVCVANLIFHVGFYDFKLNYFADIVGLQANFKFKFCLRTKYIYLLVNRFRDNRLKVRKTNFAFFSHIVILYNESCWLNLNSFKSCVLFHFISHYTWMNHVLILIFNLLFAKGVSLWIVILN